MALASTVLFAGVAGMVKLYAGNFQDGDKKLAFPDNPPDLGLPKAEKFDFIVVGGGTAGCVVARRLAEHHYKALLLEAGGDSTPQHAVPLLAAKQRTLTETNHLFQSTPQANAALKNGGILKTSAGKMLGGSSSSNDMEYEQGHPLGFDEWASTTGDVSWKYEHVLHFFKKSESHLTISRPDFQPGTDVFIQAAQELGLTFHESNRPQQVGVTYKEFFMDKGKRQDIYSAYVKPIENDMTKHLVVRRYSTADQIIFQGNTATGVSYKLHGLPRFAQANKEVILAAGAVGTPHLLMKSGVGPADHLQAANVKLVHNSPGVGQNLQDRPVLAVGPTLITDPSKAFNVAQDLKFEDMDTFTENGGGAMSSSLTAGSAEAFVVSARARAQDDPDWPDIQVSYLAVGNVPNSVQCNVGLNRPYSRGQVLLNTGAAAGEDNLPVIDYNYFAVDSDFEVMIEAAFKNIGAKFTTEPIPECTSMTFRSDDYWRCYIQQTVESTTDASGTCRMGKKTDPLAVVDSKFKVIGVKNLRVVDGSIMPRATNANTAAATVMIAEKASHDITKEHQKKIQSHRPPLSFSSLGLGNINLDLQATAG